jgi:hypothetical protein
VIFQWTLWVIGILVTIFTMLMVTVGGMMANVFKDEGEPAPAVDDAQPDAEG